MSKKPNMIFICTDQHRTDTLSKYNKQTLCKTPNLDALFEHSIVFDNAYTSYPVCTPARSSMQTGLMPSKSGMEGNSFQTGCRCHELYDNHNLLSRRLEKLGYLPLYTGKWHLGVGKDKTATPEGLSLLNALKNENEMDVGSYQEYGTMPTDVGYIGDDFPGHGNGGWAYEQFQTYLKEHNRNLIIDKCKIERREGDHSFWGEVKSGVETTIEYYLVDRAIALIETALKEDKPFYLNLNFWGPHEPFFAPTEYLKLYRDMSIKPHKSFFEDVTKLPPLYEQTRRPEVNWEFFENTLRHYYACVTHLDAQVGRLIEYLKAKDLYEEAVILFSSDHGDYQGVHGGMENKGYGMYDEITKIPFALKPSFKDFKGYVNHNLVGTCDIYSTLLDFAGGKNSNCDGRSLAPFIENCNQPWSDEIVTEGLGANNVICTQRMYRKGNLKYVFNGGGLEQVFDMLQDPYEMNNLALTDISLLKEMRRSCGEYLKKIQDPIWASFCKIYRLDKWSLK